MNVIKGLIIKDILQLKNYKKTLIIFVLIFILVSISEGDGIGNMLPIIITLGFGMFSMASFNYDELTKTDRYILTFPITKKQIVFAKYIFVICSTIIGSIVGTILSVILTLIINKQIPNIEEFIVLGLGAILEIGLIQAIQIPCVYKWGAEKGRIQMVLVTGLILFIIGGLIFVAKKANIQFLTNNILENINGFLPIIFIITTIIMYFISYKVAYKIYDKKEI